MEYGAVALWLAGSLSFLFVGLPLAAALFPRLADRGASVALPLALLVVFFVGYVVGRISLGLAAVVAPLVLVVLAAVATRRGVEVDTDAFLETALVFSAAFLFLVAVRAIDPAIDPTGGEKFLDFGLLQSVLRADALPVEDFWFAGEPVMYYYGGHLVVGQLVRLAGTAPGVAYNLALAGFFATFVTAAYGLAGNVAARAGTFDRRAGLLGAFFVAVASNLFTPLRLLLRPLPDGVAEPIARTLGVWAGRFGREGALITDDVPFSMWDATGLIDGTIHEMPLFAFTNGDLHAHMMAPAFTLLGATALFAYWRTPATARRRRLVLLGGFVPAVAGALAVVNTWSFPSIAGLTVLAVFFDRGAATTLLPAGLRTRVEAAGRVRRELVAAGLAVAAGAAVALLGVVLSLPFWLANAAGRTVAVLPDRSTLAELAAVHGGFLLPIALYFGYLAWARFDVSRRGLAAISVTTLVGLAVSALADLAVLGLVGPLLVGGYLLGSRLGEGRSSRLPVEDERLARLPGFELVLLTGALGLVLLVEFVYLDGAAASGRFNTVFKVYAQVWALFAVGTAVALGRLLQLSRLSLPVPSWPTALRGFVAVLVAALSVYAVVGMGVHFGTFLDDGREATLDGTAWIEDHPEHGVEAPAIEWLDERDGTPTIVTLPARGGYSWNGSQSAMTGVPTVVGWPHHERGFGRDPAVVGQRTRDVGTIYTGGRAQQRRLLAAYGVEYVYVGPNERKRYGENVDVGELRAVTPAATFESVTVYAVDQSALPDPDG